MYAVRPQISAVARAYSTHRRGTLSAMLVMIHFIIPSLNLLVRLVKSRESLHWHHLLNRGRASHHPCKTNIRPRTPIAMLQIDNVVSSKQLRRPSSVCQTPPSHSTSQHSTQQQGVSRISNIAVFHPTRPSSSVRPHTASLSYSFTRTFVCFSS